MICPWKILMPRFSTKRCTLTMHRSPFLLSLKLIANSSSRFNGRGKGHGRGRGQGCARFTRSLNQPVANQSGAYSSVICQLCNQSNHQATQCWYRFDHSYNTNNSTTPSALAATTAEHLYDPNWYHILALPIM